MATPTHAPSGANRTRRNIAKGAALALSVLFGFGPGKASARHGGGGDGGWDDNCFLRGTRVRTATGYRPIESICAGDLVPTHFGGLRPVRRISQHAVRRPCSSLSWPGDRRPVLVKRSALARSIPSGDVHLTPTHAVYIDGVLIPVGDLVNGRTIVRSDPGEVEQLEYFNIEFDSHDVVDAEGMACESLRAFGVDARDGVEETPCAPIVSFNGRRNELKSRWRSAVSPLHDRRNALDIARDRLEDRALAA